MDLWHTFFILTATLSSTFRFSLKVTSFAITILLSKFYYRTGSLRLGYESKITHKPSQPSAEETSSAFLSSPTFITEFCIFR